MSWTNLLNPDQKVSRRKFLEAGTAAGILGTSGCLTSESGRTTDEQDKDTAEDKDSTGEDTAEEEPDPYSVSELGESGETGTLNLVAADPDAEYASSIIFDRYNGDIPVALDLKRAELERHVENDTSGLDDSDPNPYQLAVQNFVDAIASRDNEWCRQLQQEHLNQPHVENTGAPDTIDFDILYDESRNFGERWMESGAKAKLLQHQIVNMGGLGSEDNQWLMQMMHNSEYKMGFPSLVWEHQAEGHGLGAALTNIERNGTPENQESWVIETRKRTEQPIATWQNSAYRTGEHENKHPAYQEDPSRWLYVNTAVGLGGDKGKITVTEEMKTDFENLFENPETRNAYELLDPMTASAHIIYQNPDIRLTLSQDEIDII